MMSELHKFIFEGGFVRGMLVRLTDDWCEVLRRREPLAPLAPEVRHLLGEMAAAGVLLQASIRFAGALVLQLQGDGPVRLAVAEVQSDLAFRVTASVTGDLQPGADLQALVNAHGQGRCAITLDPQARAPGQQPYQGIVPLRGAPGDPPARLSEVLGHYMRQSEQLDTLFVLAADDQVAAGLLVQRLPADGPGSAGPRRDKVTGEAAPEDDYLRIATLAATLSDRELLGLPPEQVLRRLFWEERLRRLEQLTPRFACRCSRERVMGMLQSLGRTECDSVVAERGEVEVGCEFCGQQYRFDAVDVATLFTAERELPPSSRQVQ